MQRWHVEKPGAIVVLGVLVGPAIAAVPAAVAMITFNGIATRRLAAVLQDLTLAGIVAAPFQLALLAIPLMFCGVVVGFTPGFFSACLLLVFSGLRPLTFVEQVGVCLLMSALFGLLVSRTMSYGAWEPILLFTFAGLVGAVGAGLVARARGIVVPVEPGLNRAPAAV